MTDYKELTVEEKVAMLVEQFAANRSQFAKSIGYSAQTVNNWVYRNSFPEKGIAAILDIYPQVSEDWLRGRKHTQLGGTMLLPNFNVTCGDVEQYDQSESMLPVDMPIKGVKFIFPCTGNSMEPRIYDGDFVGIGDQMNRYESFKKDKIYLVTTIDGKAMIKGVEDPGPDCPYLQLSSLNPDYRMANEGKLPKDEFLAAYKVLIIINNV